MKSHYRIRAQVSRIALGRSRTHTVKKDRIAIIRQNNDIDLYEDDHELLSLNL